MVEAEHASATGAGDEAVKWANTVAAWDEAGQPFRVAVVRHRQADAVLRSKAGRAAAAELAREALATATELGAVPLAEQIRGLAGRARLDLSVETQPAESVESRLGMTPRELEVLRLLVRGRTNRQIGEALFISEKTASVHVTNLLRKLGVPNRVEAAAVAARAGLV